MDESKIREIFSILLKDHDLDKFLEHCSVDVKFILHPKHIAAGIYDRKSIYDLFIHLSKSFPNWKEDIDQVFHDKGKRTFIIILKGNSTTIKNIWNIQFAYYNEKGKIYKIEERIDTLHLAEGNIGPRI